MRNGKKIRVETSNYQIENNKKATLLINKSPNLKFHISDKLLPLIDLKKDLFFEFTQNSKTLLFLSNDKINLLDEIEIEDK